MSDYLEKIRNIQTSWPSPESYEIEHITLPNLWRKCALIAKTADEHIADMESDIRVLLQFAEAGAEAIKSNNSHISLSGSRDIHRERVDDERISMVQKLKDKYCGGPIDE